MQLLTRHFRFHLISITKLRLDYSKITFDYMGITNETAWQSPAGAHKLKAKIGYFEYKDYNTDKRDYSLLSYRYLWAEKDVSFHITGGQFWNEDTGYKLETKILVR